MKVTKGLTTYPDGLRRYCDDPEKSQSWDAFRGDGDGRAAHGELSEALMAAQRGLCCYCEIDLIVPLDRQIEHVLSRDRFPHRALDPFNMLASCVGGSSQTHATDENRFTRPSKRNLSCGQKKGKAEALDPRKLPSDFSLFVVTTDGRMLADPAACAGSVIPVTDVTDALNVLGLNAPRLVKAREKIIKNLSQTIGESPTQLEIIARGELLPDASGNLRPWFTTRRSHFGAIAEKILAELPRDWIGS